MSKKVIITGVTGQLGSYFVDYLLEKTDYDIIGTIRRLSVSNHKNIQHLISNKRFRLASMDLADVHSIDILIREEKPDFFINCAANSFVGSSWEFPAQHLQYNSLAVLHQLESIRKHSPHTRYFNSGSSEEFGEVQYSPQDEKHPPMALSPYGASKVAARQLVRVYQKSYDLYAVQSYTFNFESPRRGEEFVTKKITQGVARIYHAIKNKLPFEPIELGSLDSKRSWQHCLDVVDGIWKMMNQEKNSFKNYVLSSNETHSVRNFIELSFKYAGIEIEDCNLERIPPVQENPHLGRQINYQTKDGRPVVIVSRKFYRPFDVQLLHGNSSLARSELKWEPKYSFNDLVSEMVKYDIDNFSS